MKNIVKNKVNEVIKKHKYNVLLSLIIFILFSVTGYSNTNNNYELYINDFRMWLDNGIYVENNEQYIHIDDLTSIFEDNIYHDKISAKLIVTTYNKLTKVGLNDETFVVKAEKDRYVNLKKIVNELGYNIIVVKNRIYISESDTIEGVVKKSRTELYDTVDGNVHYLMEKGKNVKVIVNANLKNDSKKIVNVEVVVGEKTYYGYTLKQNIQYSYEKTDIAEVRNNVILVKADDKLMQTTDVKYVDMVAINMYRLSGVNTLAKLEYTSNVEDKTKVLATINNGQKSSNYDQDIVTGMLNSESNRNDVINQIAKSVISLAGVNLDFGNFKIADKEYYTQFVKELAAVLHSNNKLLIVNIPSTQYIDVEKIANVVDYIVIQPYSSRSISSKTSGPISSLTYVEQTIQDVIGKAVDEDKIILEMPAYTILWTERRGTVINAEQYNMNTMQAYLKENNIESKLDRVSGQNYMNYTKGITTYKMWLEDEYSVTKKAELSSKYNLSGVSIYRSGMELKEIYGSISKVLNK